jgi:Ca-activated chloride channel family protein
VVKKHAVDVTIVDGVATTKLDQVFANPHNWPVEGTYIFPLADDVALGQFSMFVNGQEVEGKLLGVDEARREYESIVARLRDPALLEYLGTRMFRARIFPIEPKGEARVRLSYTQMLDIRNGLARYRYPLGAEGHAATPVEDLSVLVKIESKTPIKSVFSPSHKVAISRASDHKASASLEGKNMLVDKDFELFYALGEKEFGLTVLTYREGGQDGFFLVRIAPPAQTSTADVLPKDIAFVVDTSGSMAGEKMDQARRALTFCLANLNQEDRFNVIPFSHEAVPFRDGLVPASAENVKAATEFAEELRGIGGTNINDALLAALESAPSSGEDRPYLIVFLTDGQPTIGVTETEDILKNVSHKNARRVRLFVFGVGYDVNTHLLDLLAEQNRGSRDYVEPGEDLELTLSSFYRKVSEPVLADLDLSFGDLSTYDMFPTKLGDLFAGSELVVAGRYRGESHKPVELTGKRRGVGERFVYETNFPREDRTHEFLPRLWATRKVGYLLDQIRLHGEDKELKDTIVQLATKYGIVTPYTAYLVTEPGGIATREGRGRFIRNVHARFHLLQDDDVGAVASGPGGAKVSMARTAPAKRTKVWASRGAARMREADAAFALEALTPPVPGSGEGAGDAASKEALVERVGNRTFYYVGERWIDADYDEKSETKKVEAFSEEYFELVRKHPELARCFALGERVIVVIDNGAFETTPPPSAGGPPPA